MIRIVNIVALAITVLFAFGLYKLKYNISVSEDRLGQLQTQIEQEQEELRVLKAEWSHLNRPERIQKLTEKFLKLGPLDPGQIAEIKDIPFNPVNGEDDRIAQDEMDAAPMGGPEFLLNGALLQDSTLNENETNTRGGDANG